MEQPKEEEEDIRISDELRNLMNKEITQIFLSEFIKNSRFYENISQIIHNQIKNFVKSKHNKKVNNEQIKIMFLTMI